MDKDAGWAFIDRHRVLVADILGGLTAEQWTTPSLCQGWTVREVGAHLSLAPNTSVAEVLGWMVKARGSYSRMIRDSAIDRARRPTAEIVADLRGVVGLRKLAPTTTWRDPLLDIVVHAQDIAVPLGVSVAADVDAARTSAEWAWSVRFPQIRFGRLRGLRLVADDADWTRGRGAELHGPVEQLLLLCTGRPAALAHLEGVGRELARQRLGLAGAA